MSAKSTSSANDSRWTVSTHQGANPMAEMLEQYLASCGSLKRGQIVSGTVVRVNPTEVIVDVGAKCEGIVPEEDLLKLPPAEREAIKAGDEVLVYVVETEDIRGNVILSLTQAQAARDWHEAQRLLESQETIEREVIACNKGGVIVRLGKVNGFVPGSQLSPTHASDRTAPGSDNNDRWAGLVGKTLHLKVIEVDRQRNRLILSERRALREWRSSQRERLLNELTEGDVRQGRVINLADFGAFVDLGGIDGLIHLSELSWKRVAHPSEVLRVGQEVEVYVLGVDRERQRVALSLKRLQPDPWVTVEECYKEGQLVEGVITRLTRWGAFASIVGNEAIEGLIHISELDEGLVIHPREVIQPGKVVTLRVVGVDAAHRRLALSLKQAAQGECLDENWRELLAAEQPAPESPLSVALSEAMRPANDEEGL